MRPSLKKAPLLVFSLLLFPALTQAQSFGNICENVSGTVYASSYEELLKRESDKIQSTCQYIEEDQDFKTVAGVKSSSAQRTHQDRFEDYCRRYNSRRYCERVYKSSWQASCCIRQLF